MKLKVYHATQGKDITHPRSNCDNYLKVWAKLLKRDRFVAAVADGIGGKTLEERLEIARASNKGIKLLRKSVEDISDLTYAVTQTMFQYNSADIKQGTTLTAIQITEGRLYAAQLGDSLAYLIRADEIYQLVDAQDGKRLMKAVFKKHPSNVTLDDLVSLVGESSWRGMALKFYLLELGGYFYNMLRDDSSNARISGCQEQIGAIKAILEKDLQTTAYNIDIFKGLEPQIKDELTTLLIKLAYMFWNTPDVMDDNVWRTLYSGLFSGGNQIGGFSDSLPESLVKKDECNYRYVPLVKGDVILVMTDGVIANVIKNYMPTDPLGDPIRDWDYAQGLSNRAATRLKEMIAEHGIKKTIAFVTKPLIREDDATIVAIQYLGD